MHIKYIHCVIEELAKCIKCEVENKGIEHVNTQELGAAADILKGLCETEYYAKISKAMDESEYDVDYGWEGQKYYRGQRRDSMGRFMSDRKNGRRGYEPDYHVPPEMRWGEEQWRDMDATLGRRYTDEPIMNRSMQGSGVRNTGDTRMIPSRYGYSHDEYMKKRGQYSKDDPEQKKKRTEMLNEYMDDLGDMAKEMIADMSPEEKQVWKVKLNKLINM